MKKREGFTLIELLIVMVIMGVVAAGIYLSFVSQQNSYLKQEQVAVMQQNLRAAMAILERDMRMAGYSVPRVIYAGDIPGFSANAPGPGRESFIINMDLDQSGNIVAGTTETVTYQFNNGSNQLIRTGTKLPIQLEPLANNVSAVDFVFLDDQGNVLNPTRTGANSFVSAGQVGNIDSVQITLVVRSDRADRGYLNTVNYRNQLNQIIFTGPGDPFRRKSLTVQVQCRNLYFQ